MKKIEINEELAIKIGYKNIKGLKTSISRQFEKSTIVDGMVSVDIIIFLAGKKNNFKLVQELINNKFENINTANVDVDEVYNKAVTKIEEIKIRQGNFNNYAVCIGDIEVSLESAMLAEMYLGNEITKVELDETIKAYKLDLPISYSAKDEEMEKYRNTIGTISTNYNHYNMKDNTISYDVVDNINLSYANVVELEWAYENYTEEEIEKMKADDIQILVEDNITIATGYNDGDYICVYKDKKLIGHYSYKTSDLTGIKEIEDNIKKLLKFEQLDIKYMELYYKLYKVLEDEYKKREYAEMEDLKKNAKFVFEKGNNCYILVKSPYTNKTGDILYFYYEGELIGKYQYKRVFGEFLFSHFGLEREDKQYFVKKMDENEKFTESKAFEEGFKTLKEMLIKLGKASDEAHKAEEKRKNEEWKKRNEEWKNSNDNYDYSKLFGSFATNYSDEEQKVLKKVYKIASSKLHPDVGGNEEDMKILNGLKQKWAI